MKTIKQQITRQCKQWNFEKGKSIKRSSLNILSLLTIYGLSSFSSVNAFDIENNGWTFSLNGNVNTSYIYASCDSTGATVTGAFLCSGSQNPSAVSNGYLPTFFEFGLKTEQAGYNISAHATIDKGLDTNESFNAGNDGEGFRIWMTIGNEEKGTLLAGRSWGLFAMDSTFQDMSVLGVGGNFLVNNPVNTQLGAAGTGYIFTDRITQITYTFPTSDQWIAQIGIFQPLNLSRFSFTSGPLAGAETGSEAPGVHGRLRLNFDNGFISTTFLTELVDIQAPVATDFTAYGVDVTAQYTFSNLALTGSYYIADGLGHTGFFIDAVDPTGQERESDGYLLQGVYTINKTKFGINYGVSNLDPTSMDAGTVMQEKTKFTVGIYHDLIPHVMLISEYSHLNAENNAGGEIDNDVFNVGLILFF